MKIMGKKEIVSFCEKHNQAKGALNAWVTEVESASWGCSQDIKNRFSTASFLPDNRVVFNIKGNDYRLVVQVRYVNGIVKVERIGTHAEYDKWRLK
ncbi:type II toxin-antitoxin system HigB family toxin [Xenorhabdus anantnagensis]|uniref:Type II toxin-antitoxin system HigB family toxin n=1 Tax=Xenorhabdus anantnagensis TaxID=3025875 RepID=A0ABT5LWT0_9GAMM|nr:type II toxin-antitoxin system HigB family toxin [Xenorhabdus anantnagensis]MDC9598906.1 type II toxin-antitoxin system HigB family toxin [Xenorhabdus anantnagensis]